MERKMPQPNRSLPGEDSSLPAYIAQTLGDEALTYNADGRPVMSRDTIRNGLKFAAMFYGGLIGVVGIGVWVVVRFL
jgi:hypothetical protein